MTESTGSPSRSRVPQPELRLALALRGGVSLAVWMGGACAEIDALRRAPSSTGGALDPDASTFWRDVLARSPYSNVVVDVLAGASAGGLNGVLFSTAIRHGFSMADLLPVWKQVADVEKLRRTEPPWVSMFDGDSGFLDEIDRQLARLTGASPGQAGPSAASGGAAPEDDLGDVAPRRVEGSGYVDLQLTATLVEPVSQPAISPSDEPLRRSRSSARFHFRHDPDSVFPRRDLERAGLARLAVAARASASFPFAFEAAVVRSARTERFSVEAPDPEFHPASVADPQVARRLADCRGVFSESAGAAAPRTSPLDPSDFVVADGGIVDNIPLGKALEAISRTPASGPTRRVLVYLHPSGPAITDPHGAGVQVGSEAADRRGPVALARGLVASKLQGQSIDDDLETMEASNRNLRLRRQMRQASAEQTDERTDFLTQALERRQAYLEQRAVIDAEAVRRLLHDPLVVLGEDPFPVPPAPDTDDRWRAPIARWTAEQRLTLAEVMRQRFLGRLNERFLNIDDELVSLRRLLTGGLGPLTRTGRLLMELALATEARPGVDHAALGATKANLYRLNSLVRELDRIRQIGWVAAAGSLGSSSVDEWTAATLTDLNGLLKCDAETARALCTDLATARWSKSLRTAREQLVASMNAGLQQMAEGTPVEIDAHGLVDVRETIISAMAEVADGLVAHWGDPAGTDPTGTTYLRNVLAGSAGPVGFDTSARFAALEVLLLREHVLDAGAGVEISFTRLSAAAPTIGADRYQRLHLASTQRNPAYTGPDQLLPDVKLAGNELHNFGAFVDERWRTNDWLWGRMDAVPTLVDLLLSMDRAAEDRPDPAPMAEFLGFDTGACDLATIRRELIRRRQDEIFDEVVTHMAGTVTPDEARAVWDTGLETLTEPGSPSRARSMGDLANVGALVLGNSLPPVVPRVTGPLQAVAGWVASRYSTPKGWGMAPDAVTRVVTTGGGGGAADQARTPVWVHLLAPILGLVVAGVVWGLADSARSLLIGFVAGIVVAIVPGLFTLWLGVFRRPEPSRRGRLAFALLPFVAVAAIGAAVALVVAG